MSTRRSVFMLCFFCAALLGCRDDQREQQLAQRELTLGQREKDFALKEADYNSLLRMRDSLLTKKDTVFVQSWPEAMAGIWSSKAVCRESNCSEYVVGDQRSNFWEFVSDSTGLYTRVSDNNNKLVRVYSARYDSTGIQLRFVSDSSATKKMELSVDLTQIKGDLIKGLQNINIDKSCTSKFFVELTRSTNR